MPVKDALTLIESVALSPTLRDRLSKEPTFENLTRMAGELGLECSEAEFRQAAAVDWNMRAKYSSRSS